MSQVACLSFLGFKVYVQKRIKIPFSVKNFETNLYRNVVLEWYYNIRFLHQHYQDLQKLDCRDLRAYSMIDHQWNDPRLYRFVTWFWTLLSRDKIFLTKKLEKCLVTISSWVQRNFFIFNMDGNVSVIFNDISHGTIMWIFAVKRTVHLIINKEMASSLSFAAIISGGRSVMAAIMIPEFCWLLMNVETVFILKITAYFWWHLCWWHGG